MKLRNTCNRSPIGGAARSPRRRSGFTLIEVMVVLGIFAILAAMGLAFSFDNYRGYLFRSEYVSVINMIAQARNRAVNNFQESAHTFEILPGEYRIYPANNPGAFDRYPANPSLVITGATTLTFDQLSGHSSCDPNPCTITFSNGLMAKNITINAAGGILTN